ncbi:MAG: ABC transporter permease [Deltaproteobacteria bacterium]|nr:ABC transporter permease [Deltaproteobacteria bacterium]
MFRRIWALSIKEFIHLRNDWWLPAFMLIGGAMELLIIGWATSRPITNLPLMVLDQDKSPASRQLLFALENTGTFNLEEQAYEISTIKDAIDRGQINAALIIPPGYATEMTSSTGQPKLSVILNGAESIPAIEALRAIEGITRDIGNKILIQRLNLDPEEFAGFEPSLRVRFNEALKEALYTIPAELGLMLEFTVMLFAALAFSRERELGTLEQLLVMPFSSLEIIIGKSIPVIIIGYVDFLLMLGIANLAFGVPMRGSLVLLLIVAFGYIFVELSKGMLISVFSKSQHQAFLLVLLIGMVDFMFTGYAAPVEGMPVIVQFFANFIPANHWLSILRGILIKGANIAVLWPHILALVLLGIAISAVSWRFIRRALD